MSYNAKVMLSSPSFYVKDMAYRLWVKGRRNVLLVLAQIGLLLVIADEDIRLG